MPDFRPELETLLTNDEAVRRLKGLFANEEFVRASRAVIAGPDFAARLDRIEEILLRAGAKKVDRVALQKLMLTAALLYGGMAWSAGQEPTMHEAAKPMARLLENLKRSRTGYLQRLGAPAYVAAKGAEATHDAARKAAETRFDHLLHELEEIGGTLPDSPPETRAPTRDFDALVDLLAQYFEQITGRPFTQDWHTDDQGRRVPNAPGVRFAWQMTEFIDKSRLSNLSGAARRVVSARRDGTFQK
jgi:hypothetical protein